MNGTQRTVVLSMFIVQDTDRQIRHDDEGHASSTRGTRGRVESTPIQENQKSS